MLRRVRDYAQVKGNGLSTPRLPQTRSPMNVDNCGLDDVDRRVLTIIENIMAPGRTFDHRRVNQRRTGYHYGWWSLICCS